MRNPSPIPLPARKRKGPLNTWEIEGRAFAARMIPPGATITYGEVAKRLGGVELSRDVGQAMGENPFPPIVPCHRVVAARGKTGGFSVSGGIATKLRMLAIEGAQVDGTLPLFERGSGSQRRDG